MPAQFWESLLTAPAATAQTTQNTFTGPQDITPPPPLVLPANYFYPGTAFKVTATGTLSTTGTPTLALGVYVGTTVLCISAATTMASAASSFPWKLETTHIVRGSGTTSAVSSMGTMVYGTSLTAVTVLPVPATSWGTTVNIDTTVAASLTVKATWSASSASNIVTLQQFMVELLD